MSAPAISVLMTAYNRERFIAEAIESVLSSSFADFELVVVDDASRDRTAEIARQYALRDARISVVVNESNLGDYPNRNRAARLARGKYLKFVDSDDAIYPHGLEVMFSTMERFPSAALGLSAYGFNHRPHPVLLSPRDAYELEFLDGLDLFGRAPGSAIIRAEPFWQIGGFSGLNQLGDLETWLALARSFPVVTLPAALCWSRVHDAQEQHYDSLATKAALRFRLQRDALLDAACPLTPAEATWAMENLRRRQGVAFLQMFRRPRAVAEAIRFRKAVGLGVPTIISAAVSKPNGTYAKPDIR
jgi:glycosyltransferase involved in cell wall biosynthesis